MTLALNESIQTQSRTIDGLSIRFADAFALENPNSIGPDAGTGASLFAAADRPGRLRSLVVGSGGTVYPLELCWVLNDCVEASDLEGYRNADPRKIAAGALTAIEQYVLPDAVIK